MMGHRTRALALTAMLAAACAVPVPRERAGPAAGPKSLSQLLIEIKRAYATGRHDRGLLLVKEVLEMKDTSLSSYDRIGSTYFALGRYEQALQVWEKALPMESDALRRKSLGDSIAMTRRTLGLAAPAAETSPMPAVEDPAETRTPEKPADAGPAPKTDKPADSAPAAKPATTTGAVSAPDETAPKKPSRYELDQLYKKGVGHYTRGEYLQAMTFFMTILEHDPENAQAQKALRRLRTRPGPAGEE